MLLPPLRRLCWCQHLWVPPLCPEVHAPPCHPAAPGTKRGSQLLSRCLSPHLLAHQHLVQTGAEPKSLCPGRAGGLPRAGGGTEQLLQPSWSCSIAFLRPPSSLLPFIRPAPSNPRHLLASQPQPTPASVPHQAPEELQAPCAGHHEPRRRGEGRARPCTAGPKRDPRCNRCALAVLGHFAPVPQGALPSRESGRAQGCRISPRPSAHSRRAAASTGSYRSSLLPAEPPRTGTDNWAQRGAARGSWGQGEAQGRAPSASSRGGFWGGTCGAAGDPRRRLGLAGALSAPRRRIRARGMAAGFWAPAVGGWAAFSSTAGAAEALVRTEAAIGG